MTDTMALTLNPMELCISADKVQLGAFDVFYAHRESLIATIQEVFIDKIYDFEADNNAPFIIDAGSNIGLSALFFKMKYPQATLLCFEPDPNAFKLLTKNVQYNKIEGVHLFNEALSKNEAIIPFYGETGAAPSDPRGNSIIKDWGLQRSTSTQILVRSTRLSSYIDRPVDFLKMDIEGAEQEVLEEISEQLPLVKAMIIEIHEMDKLGKTCVERTISSLLKKYGFEVSIMPLNIGEFLPSEISRWIAKVHPSLSLLKAFKP